MSNDGFTDQRVRKQCEMLTASGFDIKLYCRSLGHRLYEADRFPTKRFRLLFQSGFLFYASLNIRLFFSLLFAKADLFYANDLDTLPANALAAAFRRKPLIYDSHEYFTEVPEVQGRPLVKSVWRFFENTFVRRANVVVTVSDSIAGLLKKRYSLDWVVVVRNVPRRDFECRAYRRSEIGVGDHTFLMVLQGTGINADRGAEEMLDAMTLIENATLLIVGRGDAVPLLKQKAEKLQLGEKVVFIDELPYREMMRYTAAADLGLSLDKATNINYRYSLPNKLFDYARAGIPVLASDLVEVRKIVDSYEIGECVDSHDPQKLADRIRFLKENKDLLAKFKANTLRLNAELNWETEFTPVLEKVKNLV